MKHLQILRSVVAATLISLLLMTYVNPVGSARADGDNGPIPIGATDPSVTGHDTTFDNIAPQRLESERHGYILNEKNNCGTVGDPGIDYKQWHLVGNSDTSTTLEGQVTSSKLAWDDSPVDHHSRDRNFFVYPDAAYANLLADPGNFGTTGEENEHGRIEVEWESAAFPAWALPMAGDKVHVEGSYIWDCGHPDDGYRTEIHPPRLVMTLRDAANQDWSQPCSNNPPNPNCVNGAVTIPARPGWTDTMTGLGSVPVPVTRADVFASSDGGEAREQETCFDEVGCANGLDWYQPLKDNNYDLFVPAPPNNDNNAQLVTKLIHHPFLTCSSDNDCGGSLDVLDKQSQRFTFTEVPGGVNIHVSFANFTEPKSFLYGFGFTLEVGWNHPAPVPPRRVKVTIEGVHVANPLDGKIAGRFEDGQMEISSLIGDTFRHMRLTGNGVTHSTHQDVPDTEDVNVGDYGVQSSGPECALDTDAGAGPTSPDPGPCQTQFEVTLLPGQPLRIFFRAEEHDGSIFDPTNENDEAGTVEQITTEAQNYGIGEYTEWFQEHTSAGDDALDEDCGKPNPTPCMSITYKIEDDPFPAPPATTLTAGSPTVMQGGNTWVTSASDLTLQATAPNDHPGDAMDVHARFWRDGTNAPVESVCGSGAGTASCILHLNANDGADGTYHLEYWAVDTATKAIEPTQTKTLLLDNTPPITSASLAGTMARGWYNTPVTVTLTALDGAGVGVDYTGYTVDGGLLIPYSAPFTVSGDKDSHTVLFYSADKLTNKEALESTSFKIDATPPGLAISSPSNDPSSSYTQDELLGGIFTNATSLDVTYAASDNLSGVYAVRLDGNSLASFSGKVTVALPAGISTHTLVAEDVAGNLTTRTFSVVSIPLPIGMIPAPQGAGFWKNAVVNVDYTSAQVNQFLAEADVASRAFGIPTNRYPDATLANYQSYLAVTPNDTVDLKVRRELLTAWLNLVSGRESATQKIDLKSVSAWQTVVTNTGGLSTTTALNLVRESERRLEGNPPPSSILLDTIQTLLNKLNAGKLNVSK